MMRTMFCAALGLVILTAGAPVRADGWGTIKGKVVFAGDPPARETLKVDKDKEECLKKGDLLSEDYVVDKETKGVQWCFVWLLDSSGDFKKELPIHPTLKAIPEGKKEVVLDQPCCMFEPHCIGLREGQTLVVKNSGKVPHNTKIDSIGDGPSINPLIPAGGSIKEDKFVANPSPAVVACSIHSWMHATVRTFKHPYFAVTDEKGNFTIENAPAGDFNIVVWQEKKGFVSKNLKKGEPIKIVADKTTELKPFELKPE
jgi:hypothetical protein